MTRWIVNNAEKYGFRMVLHLGDVIHNGASIEQQYLDAWEAWEIIDSAQIPYLIVPGNHDYDDLLATNRSLEMYNRYFGVHRYIGKPWVAEFYEEGKSENIYVKLDIGGYKYLFLGLEFGPRDEVLEWADHVLASNPAYRAVIVTHCYMYKYGDRNKAGSDHNPKLYYGAWDANDGEELWQKCFKRHANLFAVFSGHQIYENVSYRTDRGDNGNVVLQSFQNWQCADQGGEGRIRLMKVNPAANTVSLTVYNTHTEVFEKAPGYEASCSFGPAAKPIVFPFE